MSFLEGQVDRCMFVGPCERWLVKGSGTKVDSECVHGCITRNWIFSIGTRGSIMGTIYLNLLSTLNFVKI